MSVSLSCPLGHQPDEPDFVSYLKGMERLIVVVQELSLCRRLDTIMEIVRVAARELTHADGASFVLRDGEQCFYADENAIAPLWKGQRFPMKICIGGWTMQNRRPAIIEDICGDSRIPFEAYCPTFVKSLAMVPIRTIAPLGAIGVYWASQHKPTASEVKLLQSLADTTAVALENVQVYDELEQRVRDRTLALQTANQRLTEEIQERQRIEAEVRQLSLHDELTGLYNRRGFFVTTEKAMELAQRVQAHSSVLFLDLDGLKRINDELGHDAGDAMIVAAANVLKQTFRGADIIARLGGDEFVVFLVNQTGHDADVLERLQQEINAFNTRQLSAYPLSISMGMVSYPPTHPQSLERFIAEADEQMYANKRVRYARRNPPVTL